jgi:hypothetical protein
MYYSYIEIEYVATSFSPARTDLALKLLNTFSPIKYLIFIVSVVYLNSFLNNVVAPSANIYF